METILVLIVQYGYPLLFLGVVVEGEIFPLVAGFAASLGLLDIGWVILITFIGAVLGDLLWFAAARRWGRQALLKWGRILWITHKRLSWLEEHFEHNGKKTLFITKFIYSFGHSSIIVAGIAQMSWTEFIKVDVPASLLWAIVFSALGYAFGASFTVLQHALRDVTLATVIIVAIIVGFNIYIRKQLKKRV